MAYIGRSPTPAETFTSFATQEFSTSATTSYTLDHAVANENQLALFINNVRQQPGSGKAYTAVGTTLTLSAATASTDTMYAVYLGKTLKTVNPADASVGSSQIASEMITGQTALGAEPADTDEFLLSDAGTLKRVDYSYIKGGGKHTLLSTTTISSAVSEVDIESNIDSTYSLYVFKFSKMKCATDDAYMLGRVKVGGSYQTANYQYVNTDTRTNGSDFDNGSLHTTSANYFLIQNSNGQGNAADESFEHTIWLANPADTAIHKFVWGLGQGFRSEHAACQHRFFGCYDGGTGAITGMRFYMNSGNISSGTIQLYGIV